MKRLKLILFIIGISSQTTIPSNVRKLTKVIFAEPTPLVVPNE